MIKDIYVVLENVEIKTREQTNLKSVTGAEKNFLQRQTENFVVTLVKKRKNSFRSLKKCKNCGKTFFGFKH